VYRFQRDDGVVEIEGNSGRVILIASSAQDALRRARKLFQHMRDVGVAGTADQYVVTFKVDLKYRRPLYNKARKLGQLPLTPENYDGLELDEKYMALLYAQLTGKETFLEDPKLLPSALMALRNEIIRRGVLSDHDEFMDYDIAVYNAAESES
jgi:hypothetical protein